jgi:hypothetical protein
MSFTVGNPFDPAILTEPVISRAAVDRIMDVIAEDWPKVRGWYAGESAWIRRAGRRLPHPADRVR